MVAAMGEAAGLSLPNMPGFMARHPLEPGDRRHYRKTTLTYMRGYAVDEQPVHADIEPQQEAPAAVGGQSHAEPQAGSASAPRPTTGAAGSPKWVANDKKVLRWFGYFKEAVPESPDENFRVRRLVICHYLADDTTEVLEPRVGNSGLWQGCFVKRHKIPGPDGRPLAPVDIAVGDSITLYGRRIRIVDADGFTRAHMADCGAPLGPAEPYPTDPFQAKQQAKAAHGAKPAEARKAAGGSNVFGQQGRLQAYLLNSNKVLRFFCCWDDRQALYGERRPFRLHYYLEDGTAEVLEVHARNDGRDRFPAFLRRGRLPKSSDAGGLAASGDSGAWLGVEDLRLGSCVRVYGRDFFLHDCDAFTRQWYQDNLGYTPEMLAPIDVTEGGGTVSLESAQERPLPPYNGYGSPEDSAGNCRHLIPRPPKRDLHKLLNKGGVVLRFGGRLLPHSGSAAEDSERQFVVSYFMGDDAIAVFEPPSDGFPGGKFLERGRVPRPGAPPGECLTAKDLFVGARLSLHQHVFELLEADEYTLQYMENNRHEFPLADWELALAAAREALAGEAGKDGLRAALVEIGAADSGRLSLTDLSRALQLAGARLAPHQAISLHRRLARGSGGGNEVSVTALLQAVGAE